MQYRQYKSRAATTSTIVWASTSAGVTPAWQYKCGWEQLPVARRCVVLAGQHGCYVLPVLTPALVLHVLVAARDLHCLYCHLCAACTAPPLRCCCASPVTAYGVAHHISHSLPPLLSNTCRQRCKSNNNAARNAQKQLVQQPRQLQQMQLFLTMLRILPLH
jgi:hypothetical protein